MSASLAFFTAVFTMAGLGIGLAITNQTYPWDRFYWQSVAVFATAFNIWIAGRILG